MLSVEPSQKWTCRIQSVQAEAVSKRENLVKAINRNVQCVPFYVFRLPRKEHAEMLQRVDGMLCCISPVTRLCL